MKVDSLRGDCVEEAADIRNHRLGFSSRQRHSHDRSIVASLRIVEILPIGRFYRRKAAARTCIKRFNSSTAFAPESHKCATLLEELAGRAS